jgi:SAM-dependent methyltransferase
MFELDFLNAVRSHERAVIERHLPAGARVLEIGGGTGLQARELSERGFAVTSIDLEGSTYAHDRVFPVIDYDGRTLPFEPRSFDVVLSSNVLEHVRDLPSMEREIHRVLTPGGRCIHVLPTHAWRFWTLATQYPGLVQRVADALLRLPTDPRAALRDAVRAGGLVVPRRHGERGNAFTELFYFHPSWWRRHFRAHGFEVVTEQPMELFYTGHMVLGARLDLATRARLARYLGSACWLFRLEPGSRR